MTSAEDWLEGEDVACREARASRLEWLLTIAPDQSIWTFSGGWTNLHLFEEARHCFIYGQFIAASVLGFSFVERTLASLFYASGRDDLQRASGQVLIREALAVGLVSDSEARAFQEARTYRNPLVHFRAPLAPDLPDARGFASDKEPYEVIEQDARLIIQAMFRLVAKQAVG